MERKPYLELCQKYATNKKSGLVLYDGSRYYARAYMLHFDETGNALHTAVLMDTKANAEIYCKLERVEEFEKINF